MTSSRIDCSGLDINLVMAAARSAIFACGWRLYCETPGVMQVSVPFSLWSYGEDVEIRFYQGCFDISSKCSMPLQLVDWGKNRRNIDKFVAAYQRSLAAGGR